MLSPHAALWAGIAFACNLSAFGGEIPSSVGPVAVVSGFEIMEKDVPGIRSSTSGPFNLMDAIRKIAISKGELEKLGVESTPAAVRRWRDAKLAFHKERARILREVMAHPDRAKTIYETTSSSAIVFDRWLPWTLNYRTEERIAAWENNPAVGRFRFDLAKGTQPPLWMLLESMVEERRGPGQSRVPAYAEVLSMADVETLRGLGRAWSDDESDGLVFRRGVEVSTETLAMLDRMRSSVYLASFEKDLLKVIERESIRNANVDIFDPQLFKAKEYLLKLGPMELTRAQLLAPMTVSEAVGVLSDWNGRLTMAMLTLAKAQPSAVPPLIERLRVKEARGLGHVLVLLKWLEAKEALAVVQEQRLWNSGDDGAMNGSLSLIAKFDPASLEAVLAEAVAEFEAQPGYAGISKSYASRQVVRGAFYLAKYQPVRARPVLKALLFSPKPGVRLAAGRALADIGDASGVKYALEFLERAETESDRFHSLTIVERVGGAQHARALDELARRLNAPELAVPARDMEFAALSAERRWAYVRRYLGNENNKVDYWAFAKVEEGFHRNDPEIGAILEHAAGMEGAHWQRRAKELLTFWDRKREDLSRRQAILKER